jgi:hypothetical protein
MPKAHLIKGAKPEGCGITPPASEARRRRRLRSRPFVFSVRVGERDHSG